MSIKIDGKALSLAEMKTAAEDIKKLKPIQEAITVALQVDRWENHHEIVKSEVTPANLARFMVRIFLIWLNDALVVLK